VSKRIVGIKYESLHQADVTITRVPINKHRDPTGRQIVFGSYLKCLRHLSCLVLLPIRLEMKRFLSLATESPHLKTENNMRKVIYCLFMGLCDPFLRSGKSSCHGGEFGGWPIPRPFS
jgi:hypothetical protein